MNIRQLRTFCQVVDSGLRITDAADAVFRSQPSVTRQIKELEHELGFEVLSRRKNRVLGITAQGEQVLSIARRIVHDTDNLYRMRGDLHNAKEGTLTIATTHTYARYVLPSVVNRFTKSYPGVQLSLRQGNPLECCDLVSKSLADVAICSDWNKRDDDVVHIPCYKLQRSVITQARHPLLKVKPLTLEAVARYPLITYDETYKGRQIVNRAFSAQGLKPAVVLSTFDADVSKAYVANGLGIAIFATIVFDPAMDKGLRQIDARHLFAPSSTNIVLHRHAYLRAYLYDFILMFAPTLDKTMIDHALYRKRNPGPSVESLPELA